MNTLEKFTRARAQMIFDQPFFGTLALYLAPVEDATCETMWTDGRAIGFSPDFVARNTLSELKAVIAHEVMHNANLHHTRRGNRDQADWNKACDYVINPDLIAAGFTLPAGALVNPDFAGLGAEEVYRLLQKQGQDGNGAKPAQDGQPAPGNGPGKPSKDPGGCGEIRDAAPAHEPAELAAQEAEWKANIRQALAVAKASNAGQIPGHLVNVDAATMQPRVDWKAELRRFIDQSNVRDFSWSRPNRRFIGHGLILPGYVADALAHLVLVVDDSSSMDQDAYSATTTECSAALNEGVADKITVIFCNVAVHRVETFERGDNMKLTTRGRGGTRFAPAFDWIAENAPDASAIIYLTDLDCKREHFGDEPAAPVLWAAYGDPRIIDERAKRAPFGDVLHLAA